MSEKEKKYVETPLMKQYYSIKAKYPDALLLFRVGDFYETFGDDAIISSETLGIVLTRRANGSASSVELAGFPHHALDTYLPKLVKAGYRVAICDQLEDPKQATKIVKRGVTELVTPGVSYNDKTFDQKENNFLACIHFTNNIHGIALLDISTGEFYVSQGNTDYIDKVLQGFKPNEIIIQKRYKAFFNEHFGQSGNYYVATFDDWVFTKEFGFETLTKQFHTLSLKGFGIEDMEEAIIAGGGILHYLFETCHDKTEHITSVSRLDEDDYVWLDKFTIRNLELISGNNSNAKTLFGVIDNTVSPTGSRMLRKWHIMPLKNIDAINYRLNIVEHLIGNRNLLESLRKEIKIIGDIERITGKIATRRINPREMIHLKNALKALGNIKKLCEESESKDIKQIVSGIDECKNAIDSITKIIKEDPPVMIQKCGVINDGVNDNLDECRDLAFSGKDYLMNIQKREIENTGIPSLKISFNNVFGYYIEVTNTHKDKVPAEWHRKQTLVNAERYVTQELKELESKILSAEGQISSLELSIYEELIDELLQYIKAFQRNGSIAATLDCLQSLATTAIKNNYTRPVFTDSFEINILGGRHPVIEQQMPAGESYIPNDVYLDNDIQQIMMITGPNMSGKSALLRQTALIVLLAQMGSFVPAKSVTLGIVDKIFTRVGASDNITSGESTFMVEMNETASILNNISNRCLILLDEIGRGTSTYDGISIAWAISEFLHDHSTSRAKVMFATHYHELNEMANSKKRIKNYHVTVRETDNKVIFLRKLAKGGTEHSFGIHVARMAGMPPVVLRRANEILKQLEQSQRKELSKKDDKKGNPSVNPLQISLIQMEDPLLIQIRDEILNTDINSLTPIEALLKLNEIKKLIIKL
ncbi:MAG: DNA mismatch repair protein MutS [Bacteroidales bacterium]|jgi:DNA mismatch repair protein MutS|nr:DNA mismatch repair protein MutS [Bacteroidales bacterium]